MMLSIIIPIYNAEKYIEPCIDSLIAQDFQDKEILLIDDGSKDSSPQICDDYADKYDYIRVIHKDNGGCSSARNFGLKEARGDYIAFVDADDVLDHDFYSILMNALLETKSDVAVCSYKNEYGKSFKVINKHNSIPQPIVFESVVSALESMTAKENSIEGFVWNKVWKREVVANQEFRNDVAIVDDAVYSWTAISRINKACYINLPMYHYRIILNSITRNSSLDKYYKALHGYEIMIADAEENAPKCLNGLCTDYIIWNIKFCEQLLFKDNDVIKDYLNAKRNIEGKKKYIKMLGLRHRILARSVLNSWILYKFTGKLFWNLKKIYMKAKG